MTAAHCSICHRRLSDPHSIERGIGPVCAVRWGTPEQASLVDYDGPYGGGDIRLWRDDNGTAHANVPHALILHSPTGFEFGYAGSGPADLALNILIAITGDPDWAKEKHQVFKEQFIAAIPPAGGVITKAELDEFVLVHS